MSKHPILRIALLVLALLFVVATALPLIHEPYWWIRIFDFPRVQLATLGIVVLVAFWFFRERTTRWDWAVLAVLVVSVAYQLVQIWPYTPLHSVQSVEAEAPADGQAFRLVASNVLQTNRESERWLRVVREARPDLVLVTEADTWWQQQIQPLRDELPHAVERPLDNTYGMLLYSRWPLRDVEVREVVEDSIPSIWGSFELPSGESVAFAFIHPRPPQPADDTDNRDAELVLVAREVEDHDGPLIVAGDFNDVAWSYTTELFQEISGLLDPRIGRGLYATFHADYPPMRWPLDHVFHSEALEVVELRRLDHVGSDHFPILVELAAVPEAEAEQDKPEEDAEDREEAEEILDEAQDGE
ncbi:MAG: endonuclease/exonuclease/phosphatase family protein [Rhodothermales bacterium]